MRTGKIVSWRAPLLWPGNTCFLLGGGPSLKDVDVSKLKGKRVIAINNAYKLAPWADVCFFMDSGWFRQHRKGLREFTGLKITLASAIKDKTIKQMGRGAKSGLHPDNRMLNHGGNAGHCSINLAVHFGATRICLLGFDMKMDKKEHNWHREHERNMDDTIYEDNYLQSMATLPKAIEDRSIQILNLTKRSELK